MKKLFNSVSFSAELIFGLLVFLLFLFSACRNVPVNKEEIPPSMVPALVFEKVEAEEPSRLELFFNLEIKNPLPFAGWAIMESWQARINGQIAESGFSLDMSGNREYIDSEGFAIKAASSQNGENPDAIPELSIFPLRLSMDVDALAGQGLAPADEYRVMLILDLAFFKAGESRDSTSPAKFQVSGLAAFPGVQAPQFSITSIAVIKAELVNTRFRVGLKIDNPNPYPVELSAFNYELYGNGRLWADGIEKNIIKVNAKSSLQGNLFLIMNFINMKRDLLDQIINLEDVNYRFAGEAQVSTGADYLPKFMSGFDLSGYSEVLEK